MIRTFLRRVVAVAAAVVLVGSPAFAQKMGSTNRNAPSIKQQMTIGNQSIELGYIAISWASGQWAAATSDEATRGEWRTRINEAAPKSPLGSLKVTTAITMAGVKVEPGAYKLAFTLDEKFQWQITLFGDAATLQVPLALKSGDESKGRLMLALCAADEEGSAAIELAFGKQRATVPLLPAK